MKPAGPLMIEHRRIEKLIECIQQDLERLRGGGEVSPVRIDRMVDFIRTYADRTHHGKEEDILFEALQERELADEDRRLMEELVREHVFGRETTAALVAANAKVRRGEAGAREEVLEQLATLADFYPQHIEKEDKTFFPHAMEALSAEEQQAMLREFREFDRNMIHEAYESVADDLAAE
jgi:hemerythrin-like domain-containing protein